jgi:hypothetical protein
MGREIDALIAKHVMGYRSYVLGPDECGAGNTVLLDNEGNDICCENDIPNYSTSIAAAWEVVEKIDNDLQWGTWFITYPDYEKWNVWYGEFDDAYKNQTIEKTAPMAICLAALKSKGVSIEDDNSKK